jgi:Trypsin
MFVVVCAAVALVATVPATAANANASGGTNAIANGGGATPNVIGGGVTTWATYPYYADISGCGAEVIAPTWVLTAAHCVSGQTAANIHVSLSNGQHATGTYLVVHPLYNGDVTDGHDLAVIEVPRAATAGITPVQVGSPWNSGIYAPNTLATLVGRGETSAGTPPDGQLRAAGVYIRTDADMDDIYNPWYWFDDWIEDLMIGAGNQYSHACFGDSGGPLAVQLNGHPVLVGTVSFGNDDCATPNAFAELSGPQLAWVALWGLASVTSAWGACTQANGSPGVSTSSYGNQPGTSTGGYSGRDGSNYWSFACVAPVQTTPPGGPDPNPDPPSGCPFAAHALTPAQPQPQARNCP